MKVSTRSVIDDVFFLISLLSLLICCFFYVFICVMFKYARKVLKSIEDVILCSFRQTVSLFGVRLHLGL